MCSHKGLGRARAPPAMRSGSRPLLYMCCLLASVVYCCAVLLLLSAHGIGMSDDVEAADPGAAAAAANLAIALRSNASSRLLCVPVRTRPRTLLVEVPFTRFDIHALEVTVELWERTWPCYRPPLHPSKPDLVFGFNGNLSDQVNDAIRQRIHSLMRRQVVQECFARVSVESAHLSGIADTYDKRRLNANWTAGPNNLFIHFLRNAAAARGYRYMAQLEPDVMPLRPLWLEQLHCLAASSSAWVIGSPFLSHCAHDSKSKHCTGLGDEIKFHINGNALYAVGDADFRAYYMRAFTGSLLLWPFDLALHKYANSLPEVVQRRLASKFRAHPFILNYGSEPLTSAAVLAAHTEAAGSLASGAAEIGVEANERQVLPLLRRLSPDTYLVHSSWAMAQITGAAAEGFSSLGIEPLAARSSIKSNGVDGTANPASFISGASTATASIAPATSDSPVDDGDGLLPLSRRIADAEGRLLLTFATAVYDPLCRNFVAHAKQLHLHNYLLVTFSRAYHNQLVARGERPYLHHLPTLTSAGSDVFGSKDFFTINAARYTVLTRLLRAGVHVFSLDLDVVLLADPLPFVWSQPHDLLLQSDARDGDSLVETSPFLLRDRLHLRNASNVTYVNGGVFFARGTPAVARLFEDTWALTSQDIGILNEQDCLNRMLLASSLRWAPLPPHAFPNGYVYFRRPLPSLARPAEHASPVLLHCNWINGIPAKRHLLREALAWHGDGEVAGSSMVPATTPQSPTSEKFLAHSVGGTARDLSLGAQLQSLRIAMALAFVTNRTLVLPSLHVAPLDATSPRRTFTFLFEYEPLLQHLPNHRESSFLSTRWNGSVVSAANLPQLPLDAEEGEGDGTDLQQWLDARRDDELLHVGGLSLLPRSKILHAVLRDALQVSDVEMRLDSALQPAPELRIIAHHIITMIHSHLHRIPRASQEPLGGISGGHGDGSRSRRRSTPLPHASHEFNCLHVTASELSSPNSLRAAARTLPRNVPTLLVQDVHEAVGTVRDAGAPPASEGSPSLLEWSASGGGLPRAARHVFSTPLRVAEFYPYWDQVEVTDASGAPTIAYDLIQQLVCSAAGRAQGDAQSTFLRAVCHWRRSGVVPKLSKRSNAAIADDICSKLLDI